VSFKDSQFVFPKWTNKVPLILFFLGLCGAVTAHFLPFILSPSFLETNYAPVQPLPYDHSFHAGELGLDCRYCHTGAEKSFEAMVPPTQTCMNCHTSIKNVDGRESPHIKKLTEYHLAGKGIPWVRVHDLPDYVKFPHKSHVQAGLKCQECHGPVQEMKTVRVFSPMSMSWCLSCHRKVNNDLAASVDSPDEYQDLLRVMPNNADHIKAHFNADTKSSSIPQHYSVTWEEAVKYHSKKINFNKNRPLNDKKMFGPPTHCSGCHQ